MKIRVYMFMIFSIFSLFATYSRALFPIANDAPDYYYKALNQGFFISNKDYSDFPISTESCRIGNNEILCFYDDFKFVVKMRDNKPIFFKTYLGVGPERDGVDIDNGKKTLIGFLNYNNIKYDESKIDNYFYNLNLRSLNGGDLSNYIFKLTDDIVVRLYDNREYNVGGDYIYILCVYREK